MSMNVVEASGLGKRYGGTWALRECSLAIPAGHVAALVGPNGAGKTTLLNLAVGLAVPAGGVVTMLGGRAAGSPAALDGIAFVAQDTPLYKNLSAADMLHPVARHDFLASVLTAAAAGGVSVVLSSHVLAELERVAGYLILLSRGRVQLAGEVDDLLASHRVLTGPAAWAGRYAGRPVVHARRAGDRAHLLVRATAGDPVPPGWEAHPVGLEELALAYLREPGAAALPGPARGREAESSEVTK